MYNPVIRNLKLHYIYANCNSKHTCKQVSLGKNHPDKFLLSSCYTEKNMPQNFYRKNYNWYLHYPVLRNQCYTIPTKHWFLIFPIIAEESNTGSF